MKVFLFGTYRQKAGIDAIEMQAVDVEELKQKMGEHFPFLSTAKCAISINHRLAQGNQKLEGNEEIAFMPPYSGG